MKILDGTYLEQKILQITDITKKLSLKELLQAIQEAQLPTCETCVYGVTPPMLNGKKCYCDYYQKFLPSPFYCARGIKKDVIV